MTFSPALAVAGVLTVLLANPASAQPLTLSQDQAISFDTQGRVTSYTLGTRNAKELFKGARRVPKNTIFFLGANGQLYMRSGPFLEGDGSFKFGEDRS